MIRLNSMKAVAFGLGILASTTSNAALFEGSSSATFGTPDSTGVYTGVGTNTFTTGSSLPSSSSNIFTVDGLSYSTSEDALFAIADLTYTNGRTYSGSVVDTVPLDIALDFTTPTGISELFTFTFDLNVTPNTTGNAVLDADTLNILNVISSTNFLVASDLFTLQLVGFSDDNGTTISNTFTLPEDETVTSQLYGIITLANNQVPTPATLLLFVTGLVSLLRFKNKK